MATEQDNLVEENPIIAYPDLVAMVQNFQTQLESLDYRVTNKNFGSKLYQTKETIASKGRFIAGSKDDVVIMDGQHPLYRLWAGAADPADAPFSVDKDGNMIATSLDLSGYLQHGEALADIGTGNITGTYIASDAITTPKIATNAVTATKISVATLSAISANIGSVTAGNITGVTITGGLLQTSSSGLRTVIDGSDDEIKFMNGSTVYSRIYPNIFPQGFGITIETVSADSYMFVQEGTHNSAGIFSDNGYFSIYDGDVEIGGNSIDLSANVDINGDLEVKGGHITVDNDAFLRVRSMTGATATGLSGVQNGAMYYRSDVGDLRVRIAGAWRSVNVT